MKKIVNHPASNALLLVITGFTAGLMAQHSVDLKEQWDWLNKLLASEQLRTGLVGVIGIVFALMKTIGQQETPPAYLQTATLSTTPAASYWSLDSSTHGLASILVSLNALKEAHDKLTDAINKNNPPDSAAPLVAK